MNPFEDAAAVVNSNYSSYEDGRLLRRDTGAPPSPLTSFVHDNLRALILNDHFVCVAGKSAFRRGAYRFGLYPELGSHAATSALARDLYTFVDELPSFGDSLSTCVASFEGPTAADELAFEEQLWTTLQALHDLDAPHHAWDPSVSDDPDDPHFSFSFAGAAFFVVGLHAASSRVARRFAWPTLIFNPHRQFERLREDGSYRRFQQVIRRGETELQGDVNPMLANFGSRSEAAQYSGRDVGAGWTCPFHTRAHDDPAQD
jgi:FPC/CPF motif-containing protein YcgG